MKEREGKGDGKMEIWKKRQKETERGGKQEGNNGIERRKQRKIKKQRQRYI